MEWRGLGVDEGGGGVTTCVNNTYSDGLYFFDYILPVLSYISCHHSLI